MKTKITCEYYCSGNYWRSLESKGVKPTGRWGMIDDLITFEIESTSFFGLIKSKKWLADTEVRFLDMFLFDSKKHLDK